MKSQTVARNTILVFVANIISMGLGFMVSVLVAAHFSSGYELDAFFIALPIPIIIGYFVLAVSLVGVVPFYQRIQKDSDTSAANRAVAPLFWCVALISGVIAVSIWIYSSSFAYALAPGFNSDRLESLSLFLRWSSLSIPFIASISFLQSIQNANHLFLRAAFSRPLMGAFALGALTLVISNNNLVAYFQGLALGSALALAWQLVEVRAMGVFPFSFTGLGDSWKSIRKSVGGMATARGMGHSSEILLQVIASLGIAGTVAIYAFAFRLASIPLMLAVSLSLVLFPLQAQAGVARDKIRLAEIMWKGVRALSLLGALFGIIFYVWADQLVIFLYEHGDFSPEMSASVSDTLKIFAPGLLFVAANNAIGNTFWVIGKIKERVFLEFVSIVLLLVSAWMLAADFGARGIALAYLAHFVFLFFAGLWRLKKDGLSPMRELLSIGKLAAVAVFLALAAQYFTPGLGEFREMTRFLQLAVIAGGALGILVLFVLGLLVIRDRALSEIVSQARKVLFPNSLREISSGVKENFKDFESSSERESVDSCGQ
ncbi:MAG: polysaccharide biosynthesis C-terminal domain-containing protein [candidate division Zixibacteria bacterium]|nr:polysaccharide biosynthesis C-terminal domain-containing protein [candidate division Zixibacteria bacterium]